MKILITGASGFIGRHVCLALTQQGHEVIALMRSPDSLATLRTFVRAGAGAAERISVLAGDLETPELGLTEWPAGVDCVVHLVARFAWHLPPHEARHTNVTGSLRVAELARALGARLVFVTGFMLANTAHLERSGIDLLHPDRTRWHRVYRRLGGYEASKLESGLATRAFVRQNQMDSVEIQPATVAGHSATGHIDPAQPLYALMDNLFQGRMAMIPGSPHHWLPLIPVDTLAALIAAACCHKQPPRTLLALDDTTPNLRALLATLASITGQGAPSYHVPVAILRGLLRVPGVAGLLKVAPESLDFIQPQRFDTTVTRRFLSDAGIPVPAFQSYLAASAHYYLNQDNSDEKIETYASN
ncbi:SDR family oxidoreductase [Marinobacter arenosus]|uniref:SDR family oxidoreductase n=1 Tax=Marinobacter arenosus TaxID=2856822 RepID=UPI001C4C1E41|nr:SDR family oxidoreductase [Marinobacter arenosus]MBW0147990.1 SDR family oxidoreductase [Marinobacter arenosus]